ncbi:lymphotoxin-alpha [Halichoeres trimaculatus]|uniref:lymphotoxin-alpha n=1 Tax=Halichoeres trimaculatus TaxID=147232 RepID=UPI003D9EA299
MEDDYGPDTAVQLLRQEHRHLQRLSKFLAAVHLLLISAVFALAAAVVFGARAHSPDCKPTMQSYTHPPAGDMEKHQQHTDLESPSAVPTGDKEEPRHCTDFTTPSAMLTAPEGVITKGKYLDWESTDGNAHCCGGFIYSSGRLVVPRQGMYRVFLQITFESGAEPCASARELKLTNIVYLSRVKYPKDVALLSSVDTVTCSLVSWRKSLYTSGLFLLEANSTLLVTSSSPELIARREEEVFFGAEFVSS